MSLQDDHFDLEAYFKDQIKRTRKGTSERKHAEAARDAYRRVWSSFVEAENETEELRPIVVAVTTLVTHVINKHYRT